MLRVVPVEEGNPARRSPVIRPAAHPAWPNEHLYRGWDFGTTFSYPQVYPNVGARMVSVVGDVDDATSFASRLEAELYLLHFGVNVVESVGGDRMSDVFVDTDLRIPFRLGASSMLLPARHLLPGGPRCERRHHQRADAGDLRVRRWGRRPAIARRRDGGDPPAAGLLDIDRRLNGTAALYGGMISWRFVDQVQVRLEAAGEIATTDGDPDRLSLLPGVVFFPWAIRACISASPR